MFLCGLVAAVQLWNPLKLVTNLIPCGRHRLASSLAQCKVQIGFWQDVGRLLWLSIEDTYVSYQYQHSHYVTVSRTRLMLFGLLASLLQKLGEHWWQVQLSSISKKKGTTTNPEYNYYKTHYLVASLTSNR